MLPSATADQKHTLMSPVTPAGRRGQASILGSPGAHACMPRASPANSRGTSMRDCRRPAGTLRRLPPDPHLATVPIRSCEPTGLGYPWDILRFPDSLFRSNRSAHAAIRGHAACPAGGNTRPEVDRLGPLTPPPGPTVRDLLWREAACAGFDGLVERWSGCGAVVTVERAPPRCSGQELS
jgi:hypothetical protein